MKNYIYWLLFNLVLIPINIYGMYISNNEFSFICHMTALILASMGTIGFLVMVVLKLFKK